LNVKAELRAALPFNFSNPSPEKLAMADPEDKRPPNRPNRGDSGKAELALPAPYPDYIACPHCGELEVEIWCNEDGAYCHACSRWIEHEIPPDCVTGPGKDQSGDLGFESFSNSS
jgi:hypothetical protein